MMAGYATDGADYEALGLEAEEYLEDARRHKAMWEWDHREAYFLAAPIRARSMSSRVPHTVRPQDQGEANTSFACEMATDFATVIMNTFMPETAPWCARAPGFGVPDAVKSSVRGQIEKEDKVIFEAIAASNFYAECSTEFIPDMSIGTVAMWIDDPYPYAGIECQAVPLHELEISTGPTGHIDFRAHVQWTTYRKLQTLIPKIKLPESVEKLVEKKPKRQVDVRKCFWRDWSVETDIAWQYVVMVGREVVYARKIRGDGCCPLIVSRFNPMKEWAFGFGPMLQSLPDLRHMDELAAAKIMNCDLSLRPPITIPDDSVVNFEEGVEAGKAYPIRAGSEDAVKNIYEATSPDVAIYDRNDVEQRVRRLHFLDFPMQAGKTPPSAAQWLDMRSQLQQRMGTPGQAFWREWCAAIFTRFEYLLAKRGVIGKVKHDGKQVSLMPVNPARKSADTQKVAEAARIIEIGGQAFPEEFKAAVDGTQTLQNLVELGDAKDVIAFRDKSQIASAVAMIQKLSGGATPGAPMAAANAPAADASPPPVQPAPAAPTLTQIRGKM